MIRELQDTLSMVVGIQARQAEMIKAHADWLASHDRAMIEIREQGRQTDKRIEALVSAIGEMIRKG